MEPGALRSRREDGLPCRNPVRVFPKAGTGTPAVDGRGAFKAARPTGTS